MIFESYEMNIGIMVTFHGVGKIGYDNKGLSGVPYPTLYSDSVVLADFD